MAKGATFQGVNLLETGATAQNVVTGYTAGTGVTTMAVSAYVLEAALDRRNNLRGCRNRH